jgi:phage recombination protein Bet
MANEQQVAVIQPPRLPYHEALRERFGIDKSGWKVLCESVFPAARTPDAIVLALAYCKARRLDPFKRNIHIVPIYDSRKGVEVETVWPGIAEHRTTAMRTKSYAGMEPPAFGPMVTRRFEGDVKVGRGQDAATKHEVADVIFPEWCQITVYRMVQGQRVPFPGPKVLWLEFYMRRSRFVELPNEQWAKRPTQMLEKCAEAGALRRAFPEELGEDWTVEEAGSFIGPAGARHVDAEVTTTPPEPRRTDVEDATVATGAAAVSDRPAAEAGPAAASDGHRESPSVSDEPSQSPKTSATTTDSAVGGPAAADSTTPPDKHPPDLSLSLEDWTIDGDVIGQENVIRRLERLLDLAETLADVDAIEKQNAARIAKITGVRRSALNNAIRVKRESLAP